MMKSLDRLIRFIGFALIPIGAALFYNELMVQGNEFSEAVPAVVARTWRTAGPWPGRCRCPRRWPGSRR